MRASWSEALTKQQIGMDNKIEAIKNGTKQAFEVLRNDEVVGYNVDKTSRWAKYQYEYFKRRDNQQAIERTVKTYQIPPIVVKRAVLSLDGYRVRMEGLPGNEFLSSLCYEDERALSRIKESGPK